jgi:ribosomal protein S18 acetylase RimI-like enzyme
VIEPSTETPFRIEPLHDRHDRAAFSCGIDTLDHYLRTQAGQNLKKRVAAVFVATPDGKTIAGFYTLSAHLLNLGDLPPEIARKLPKYPHLPTTLLGRLAVSLDFRRPRLGEFLLLDALRRALVGSKHVASAAVVVDAKNEEASAFYRRYDFVPLPSQPTRLFYLMSSIAHLFGLPSGA